jgi:hypothetical protein
LVMRMPGRWRTGGSVRVGEENRVSKNVRRKNRVGINVGLVEKDSRARGKRGGGGRDPRMI